MLAILYTVFVVLRMPLVFILSLHEGFFVTTEFFNKELQWKKEKLSYLVILCLRVQQTWRHDDNTENIERIRKRICT